MSSEARDVECLAAVGRGLGHILPWLPPQHNFRKSFSIAQMLLPVSTIYSNGIWFFHGTSLLSSASPLQSRAPGVLHSQWQGSHSLTLCDGQTVSIEYSSRFECPDDSRRDEYQRISCEVSPSLGITNASTDSTGLSGLETGRKETKDSVLSFEQRMTAGPQVLI